MALNTSLKNFNFRETLVPFFIFIFYFFCLSRAAPEACGGSQARGLIGAVAAGLRQRHCNVGSKLHLRPTPQLTSNARSLTH